MQRKNGEFSISFELNPPENFPVCLWEKKEFDQINQKEIGKVEREKEN